MLEANSCEKNLDRPFGKEKVSFVGAVWREDAAQQGRYMIFYFF